MLDKVIAAAACRCGKHPGHPCSALATAEDMLCDACRATAELDQAQDCITVRISYGCCVVFMGGTPLPWHVGPDGRS
jgi:hypothetical protein